jgi:hypothetical protein
MAILKRVLLKDKWTLEARRMFFMATHFCAKTSFFTCFLTQPGLYAQTEIFKKRIKNKEHCLGT